MGLVGAKFFTNLMKWRRKLCGLEMVLTSNAAREGRSAVKMGFWNRERRLSTNCFSFKL